MISYINNVGEITRYIEDEIIKRDIIRVAEVAI